MSSHPDKIGKYEILGVAGRGAMGTVYAAHDPFVDRKVAIKVCSSEQSATEDHVARRLFFNEAQAAGALDHRNILRVFDAGEADGQPFIVMEYVEGADTLRPYCAAAKRLSDEQIIRYMRQCAEALAYAHQHGVTHRDIKPANVMLTQDKNTKICDFGIAQRTQTDRTMVLTSFGSPLYMSPEQARDEDLNHQTDIYSLGVTMYELLASRPPFRASGLAQLVVMITTQDPASLTEVRPDVSPALAQIVRRAMHRSRSERYQNASEMAKDLAALEPGHVQESPQLSDSEMLERIRGLEFFKGFGPDELEEIVAVATWERYAPGDLLLGEGQDDKSLFVIANGRVDVAIGSAKLESLQAGDCVGELSHLSNSPHIASVRAATAVEAVKLGSAVVEWGSLPLQTRFNKTFQRVLVERLRSTTLKLAKQLA